MHTVDIQMKTEQLTDAFHTFNQLSQNLVDSYRLLEEQVAKLTQELAAARSERLKTLMEKEKLAARLQSILAALPAAVLVLNDDDVVVDCNPMAVEFLGEPLLQQTWQYLKSKRLSAVPNNPHEWLLANGKLVSLTRNGLGAQGGQLLLLSDVSELRSLQDLLSRQQQLSAMGEMMASMAHQVRTPLSTAILYASQLGKPAVQEGKRQVFAAKILERLHHLDRQVNDMLLFAKEGRLEMESFSLRVLLARLQDVMADYTLSGLIDFTIENDALEDEVRGNLDALQGALLNLLKNAIDAVIGGGSITLRIVSVQCGLLLSIQDDGMGMESEAQQKIFEPFFTTKVNGMGLGLAVVASVIKAHGGEIQCASVKGQGTEFSIFLPSNSELQQPLASHFSAQVFPVMGGESCHNMMY